MKKVLSLALVFVMTITCLCAVNVFAADASGNFGKDDALTWTWTEATTTLTISGNGAIPTYADATLATRPYHAYAATATNIIIEEGITSIGDYAFKNFSALTYVSFPDGLTYIGGWSFQACNKLKAVDIPGSVKTIGYYAFNVTSPTSASLNSITLNEGLKTLSHGAFSGCPVKTITLPQSLKTIGYQVFHGSALKELTIPKNVTSIGYGIIQHAFWTIGENTERRVIFEGGRTENLILPKGIFANCAYGTTATNLTSVVMADKVYIADTITDVADLFGGTTVPSRVTITTVDKRIAELTDNNSLGLPTVKLLPEGYESMNKDGDIYWTFKDGQLDIYGTGKLESYHDSNKPGWNDVAASVTKMVIHDGITGVQLYTDYGITQDFDLVLPSTLVTIGESAFAHSSTGKVKSINEIPEGVTSIGAQAFQGSIISGILTIPSTVTRIGSMAFNQTKLNSIVFAGGNGDLTIGTYFAAYTDSLRTVVFPKNLVAIGANAFVCATKNNATVTFEGNYNTNIVLDSMFASRNANNVVKYYDGATGWENVTSESFTTGTGGSVTVTKLTNKLAPTATVNEETKTATVNYRTNVATVAQPYAFFIAAYDETERLIGVDFVTGTIESGENSLNAPITVNLEDSEIEGTPATYKAFLWDGITTLNPII